MDIENVEFFLLVFIRITSFFVAGPFFSMRGIPAILKIGFSFVITIIIFFTLPKTLIHMNTPMMFYMLLIKEVLVGLTLGFVTNLVFLTIQMGGQIVDIKVGFSMSAMFDPVSQSSVSIFGRLYNWIGLVLFFTLNGHYFLIYGISESFNIAPLGFADIYGIGIENIVFVFSKSFLIAFMISIPIALVIFITDIIMGFIARTVPQLNIFIFGLPLKALVGLLAFVILLPQISNMIIGVLEDIPSTLNKIIQLLY